MQNLSSNQKQHLYEGGHVGVTITGETLDGDPIALTEDDIIEGSFVSSATGPVAAPSRSAARETSELVFELDNADGRWSNLRWEGARLTVVLDIAGEPLQAGVFTVDEPPRKLTTMQIRALDDMARFNRPYEPGIPYPATLRQILIDACAQCNVTLKTYTFTNHDYVVSRRPGAGEEGGWRRRWKQRRSSGDDITFHHIVSWIAELAGCNAWIDELARLNLTCY